MRKLLLDLPSTQPALGFDDTADALAHAVIVERLEPLARDLARRLLRMYRQGDVARATSKVA